MITITRESALLLAGTSRLICLKSIERGWKVRTPYIACAHYFIDRGDGRELHIFSATPPTVSFSSAQLVNNKYATTAVLEDAGITQLPVMQLNGHLTQLDEVMDFIKVHGRVVVKPIDGGHGNGITVNVATRDDLIKAHHYALEHTSTFRSTIIQKQLVAEDLHDIRVAVINGAVVGAIERVPARVCGDGVHTVGELIAIENQQQHRGEPYRAKLAHIDMARARAHLGNQVDNILADGEWQSVMAIANYGAGGELVDVTDDIPQWMRDESIKAAAALGLDVAGVDYLSSRTMHVDLGREASKGVITEVNKCPSLQIHDEPTVGKNRHATEAYLDFIATL